MPAARKADDHDSDGAVHKRDTLPPPAGEDDVYSAATRVGPLSQGLVDAMMAPAQATEASSLPPPASMTRDLSLPRPARVPSLDPTGRAAEIQRIYDRVEAGNIFVPSSSDEAAIEEPYQLPPAPARSSRVVPRPVAIQVKPITDALKPLLDDEARTRRMEALIFLGAMLAVLIPAAIAFLYWIK